MSDMSLQNHLLRRHSTYYFRAKIPVDLHFLRPRGSRDDKLDPWRRLPSR